MELLLEYKAAKPYAAGIVDATVVSEFTCNKEFPDDDLFISTQLWPDSQSRFKDAATLIRKNAGIIVDETAGDMLNRYPDLTVDMPRNAAGASNLGTLRCKTDLSLLLNAIADDIEFGGSGNTTTAFKFYLEKMEKFFIFVFNSYNHYMLMNALHSMLSRQLMVL